MTLYALPLLISPLSQGMRGTRQVQEWAASPGAREPYVSRSTAVAIALTPPSGKSAQPTSPSIAPPPAPQRAASSRPLQRENPLHLTQSHPQHIKGGGNALQPAPLSTVQGIVPANAPTVEPEASPPRCARCPPVEPVLLLLLSALGGYLGTLLRIGTSYLRPVKSWELFPGSYVYP